jgi:hypothetical protein
MTSPVALFWGACSFERGLPLAVDEALARNTHFFLERGAVVSFPDDFHPGDIESGFVTTQPGNEMKEGK